MGTAMLSRRSFFSRASAAAVATPLAFGAAAAASTLFDAERMITELESLGYRLHLTDAREVTEWRPSQFTTLPSDADRRTHAALWHSYYERCPASRDAVVAVLEKREPWRFGGQFDAAKYVDHMIASGFACHTYFRGPKLLAYDSWLPENFDGDRDGKKCKGYIAELAQRGRAFQVLPGETAQEAMDRVRGGHHYA